MTTARGDVVLRATSSTVVFAAVVGICAVLVGDAALRGRWDVVLASLPTSALVIWVAAVLFALPALRISDAGLRIVNILRTTDAPWGLIEDVTTRYQVVVALKDGTSVRSWGAPSSARAPAGSGDQHTDSSGRVTSLTAHRVIDDALGRHADDAPVGQVIRTWNVGSVITGVVLFGVLLTQAIVNLAA